MVKLARKPPADGSPPGKKEKEKAKDKEKDKDREKEKEAKPTASKKVWIWISILFTMVYLTKNSWKEILRASLPLTLFTDRLPGVGCSIEIVVKPSIPYIERTYNLLWWCVYFAERVSSP